MKPIQRVKLNSNNEFVSLIDIGAKKENKNAQIAKETLAVIEQGHYITHGGTVVSITEQVKFAHDNTKFYSGKEVLLCSDMFIFPNLEVVNETTTQAADRLIKNGKNDLVILNFASAVYPGGNFLGGAQSQEEDLCRRSALYPCIKSQSEYYNQNILCDHKYYTDGIIYSPKVPFFRGEDYQFLEQPNYLSVITCPAPAISFMDPKEIKNDCESKSLLEKRIKQILLVAHVNGHRNIILGAWGTGAFGNDVEMVAETFAKSIQKIAVFENIHFAVYDTRKTTPTLNAFKKAILDTCCEFHKNATCDC